MFEYELYGVIVRFIEQYVGVWTEFKKMYMYEAPQSECAHTAEA